MPKINVVLPGVGQSISRPIIFDIIGQLQKITGVTKDTKIFYPGDIQKMQTPGSSIDSDKDKFPLLGNDRFNFIDVEENFDIEALATTAMSGREHIPVFVDTKLDMYIAPIYATTDIIINFRHIFTSKTEATKWRDNIRGKISAMNEINLHDITYHYLLTPELLLILKAVYTKREAYLGYGQSFEEYIISNSTSRLTVLSDLASKDSRLAISETQTRIVGLYGFSDLPDKPERDDNNGTWTITYSYKFSYEKPLICFMKYPIMVHNNLIPVEFTKFNRKFKDPLENNNLSYSSSFKALSIFESDSNHTLRTGSNYMLRLPNFDDFDIPNVPSGTGSIFLALCQVDTNDNKTLLDLNDLGDVILDRDILNFIKESEYPYINDLYKSILNISLYRNTSLISSGNTECDTTPIIKSKTVLDLRNQHRLRFSIVTDLSLLSKEALERLRKYPKVLVKLIGTLNEVLKNNPDFIKLGDDNYVDDCDFSIIYKMLTGYNYTNSPFNINNTVNCLDQNMLNKLRSSKVSFNTVQISGIIALKN